MKEVALNQNQFFEVDKITNGSYHPLSGFMTENEFYSVIDNYILPDGRLFSMPIFLDISKESAKDLKINSNVKFLFPEIDIQSHGLSGYSSTHFIVKL